MHLCAEEPPSAWSETTAGPGAPLVYITRIIGGRSPGVASAEEPGPRVRPPPGHAQREPPRTRRQRVSACAADDSSRDRTMWRLSREATSFLVNLVLAVDARCLLRRRRGRSGRSCHRLVLNTLAAACVSPADTRPLPTAAGCCSSTAGSYRQPATAPRRGRRTASTRRGTHVPAAPGSGHRGEVDGTRTPTSDGAPKGGLPARDAASFRRRRSVVPVCTRSAVVLLTLFDVADRDQRCGRPGTASADSSRKRYRVSKSDRCLRVHPASSGMLAQRRPL